LLQCAKTKHNKQRNTLLNSTTYDSKTSKTTKVVLYYKPEQCKMLQNDVRSDGQHVEVRKQNIIKSHNSLTNCGCAVFAVRLSPSAVPLEFTHHLSSHTKLTAPDTHHVSTYRALQHQQQTQ